MLGSVFVLMSIAHVYPLSHDWLTLKIAVLLVYIVFGSLALRRVRTARVRVLSIVFEVLLTRDVVAACNLAIADDLLRVMLRA